MNRPEGLSIPRPEYPRPQFVRREWLNLNGEWEFSTDTYDQGLRRGWDDGRRLGRRIQVPFAYQTRLSGINNQDIHQVAWYARSFEVPETWRQGDVLLHFGAVDYKTTVWVNGQKVFGFEEWRNGVRLDRHRFPVQLKAGKNTVLVKVCQAPAPNPEPNWEFFLRVVDSTGKGISMKSTLPE